RKVQSAERRDQVAADIKEFARARMGKPESPIDSCRRKLRGSQVGATDRTCDRGPLRRKGRCACATNGCCCKNRKEHGYSHVATRPCTKRVCTLLTCSRDGNQPGMERMGQRACRLLQR